LANSIKEYFDKKAKGFDAFYSQDKNIFSKLIDKFFRQSMRERFKLTMQECSDVKNRRILDIGCGPGRYSVELAKQRPKKVIGIDFADNMLRIAQNLAKENNVQDICEFIRADFLKFHSDNKFDISLAIGFFDYFKYPQAALRKIKSLTSGKAILSFPARWDFRTLIRKIRLKFLGCSVYFYTENQIRKLLNEAGFGDFEIKDLGRDYLVIARIQKQNGRSW
jgi:SAM-dependent methyltransferase